MPSFGDRSKANLMQLHPDLQAVANEVIKDLDFTIIWGYRGEYDQNKAFKEGKSKARFGQSAHNTLPSRAFDFIPYPFKGWNDHAGFLKLAKAFVEAGKKLHAEGKIKLPVRSGGDWNMNNDFTDEKFVDTPHIELHPWREVK